MNDEELHSTIIEEIETRMINLSTRVNRIKNDIAFLASEAVELHVYFSMMPKVSIYELSKELNVDPKNLNKMKRSCKLTHKSPHLNRSLLSRFSIIP